MQAHISVRNIRIRIDSPFMIGIRFASNECNSIHFVSVELYCSYPMVSIFELDLFQTYWEFVLNIY